jgi:tetratricopeptide (TPR) repeat protein
LLLAFGSKEVPHHSMRVYESHRHSVLVLLSIAIASPGLFGFPGGASQVQEKVEQLFQQAQTYIAKGQYDAAADQYRAALALEPRSPQALSNLGVCLYLGGHLQRAVEPLQNALRIDPTQLSANLILGLDYVKLGEPEKALPFFQRVLQQDSKNRDAFLGLASAFLGMHQYDKAGEIYARELRIYATDFEGWYSAGLAFEQVAEEAARKLAEQGKDSSYSQRLVGEYLTEIGSGIEAEETIRRALSFSEKDGEGLHAALGFALMRLEEPSNALKEFQIETRLHPGNLDGRLGLAAAEMQQKHFADGIAQLCGIRQTDESYLNAHTSFFVTFLGQNIESDMSKSASEMPPSANCQKAVARLKGELDSPGSAFDPEVAFSQHGSVPAGSASSDKLKIARALQESKAGRYSDCTRDLQGVALSTPEEGLHLARCACLSGRYLASLEASGRVIKENSQNPESYYWRAASARSLAKAAFQRAMSLNPSSWQGQLLLGDIYRQRKDWEAAITHYKRAAQLKPTSAAAYLGLGTLSWENGWFDKAKVPLAKVLELDPENAQANLELGDIAVRAHRFEEALPLLQKSLAHNTHRSLLAHADLGKTYAELGRVDDAIAELSQASPMDRSGEIHFQLYKLYQKQGQSEFAQKALAESERLRQQEAQDIQHHLGRATQMEKADRSEKH